MKTLIIFLSAPITLIAMHDGPNKKLYEMIKRQCTIHRIESENLIIEVKNLLCRSEIDPNMRPEGAQSLLQMAAERGLDQICLLLIQAGAYINIPNNPTKLLYNPPAKPSPLICAFKGFCSDEVCATLIQKGADITETNIIKETPLHLAATRGYLKTTQLLIQNGANINAYAENFATPLTNACREGKVEIVKLLLSHHASIYPTPSAKNPFIICCAPMDTSHAIIVELILKHIFIPLYKRTIALLCCFRKLGDSCEAAKLLYRHRKDLLKPYLEIPMENAKKNVTALLHNTTIRQCVSELERRNKQEYEVVRSYLNPYKIKSTIHDLVKREYAQASSKSDE